MAAITICSDFGAPQNKVWHCFPIYLSWSDGTGCHDLRFLNVQKAQWMWIIGVDYSLFNSIITSFFSLYFLFPLWSTAPHSPTFLFSLSSYSSSSLFYFCYAFVKGLSYSWDSKESTCNTGIPGSGRSPDLHAFLRRARQRTLVFLPGESHRQRSLAGYGPWVRKESDMTEWLTVLSIVCNGPKELRFLSLNLKY